MFCKLCSKRIKYCGNTTNMHSHLWGTHRRDHSALLQEEESKQKLMPQGGSKEVLELAIIMILINIDRDMITLVSLSSKNNRRVD